MKAEILSVGTELLLGQITDTNAPYLAQHLSALGIDNYYISQIGDNLGRLVDALRRAWARSDLIIITGGLGPTEDDLTREALAELLGEEMVVQPELEAELRAFFSRRGIPMPERNVKQATLIASARAIPNPIGTAPGWWVEKEGHIVVCMPGVPVEMKKMWEEQVVPRLQQRAGGQIILSRTLKIWGLGESTVEHLVADYIRSTSPTLATYAKPDGIHLRITAKATSRAEAEALIADFEPKLRAIVGDHIYGVDDETLAGVTGRLLREQGLWAAAMESVSGGLLASLITDAPGSSACFRGGIVAYDPSIKIASGVPAETIERHGVVSPETALAMARAARERLDADIGLATTGVAGPDSLEGHPPGTVHVAIDDRGNSYVESTRYSTTRGEVKRRAAMTALYLLWRAARGAEQKPWR